MNNCHVCRGRVNTTTQRCMRCDIDLSYLIKIKAESKAECLLAIQSLLDSNFAQAKENSAQALRLINTPFTQILNKFIINS